MFSTDQLTCDQVRQQQVVLLPLSALPTVAANLDVPVSYDQVYEIPGNLAGGIGPASPPGYPQGGADGQQYPDRRYFDGFVLVKPHGPDTVKLQFFVEFITEDTVDFLPGNIGTGLESHITLHMVFLEGHDRAYDVPFTARYVDADNFPDDTLHLLGDVRLVPGCAPPDFSRNRKCAKLWLNDIQNIRLATPGGTKRNGRTRQVDASRHATLHL